MRKNKAVFFGAVLLLAAALLLFVLQQNNLFSPPEYNGERIRNTDQYALHFTAMNGEQTHTLSLKAGDILHCVWRIDQGDAAIVISMAETKIYQGDKMDTADFELVIPMDGDCMVSVHGQHAAGWIDVVNKQVENDPPGS